MLRELSAGVLLLGLLSATELHTNVSSDTYQKLSRGPALTWLSDRRGLGMGINAAAAGLASVDAHYSVSHETGPYVYTLSPFFGLSGAYQFHELPQGIQFSMGLQGLVSYRAMTLGVQYWHMSNGSALGLALTDVQNIGLDLLSVQLGYSY